MTEAPVQSTRATLLGGTWYATIDGERVTGRFVDPEGDAVRTNYAWPERLEGLLAYSEHGEALGELRVGAGAGLWIERAPVQRVEHLEARPLPPLPVPEPIPPNTIFGWSFARQKGRRMVDWFNLLILFRVGLRTVLTLMLGKRSDRRHIQAKANTLESPGGVHFELPMPEVWLDHVSDLGDGHESTIAVARMVTSEQVFGGSRLPRGDALLFGGDLVYPDAREGAYAKFTEAPYAQAISEAEPLSERRARQARPRLPWLLSIPGNHDWYDNLAEFSDRFTHQGYRQDHFAGDYAVVQERSYFSLRAGVDQAWWVLAVDTHSWGDLDAPQMAEFLDQAANVQKGDPVILVCPQPFWMAEDGYPRRMQQLIEVLEQERGARLVLAIAGDRHHYVRQHDAEGVPLLTAGGGGAFMHPTHGSSVEVKGLRAVESRKFPPPCASRLVALVNLLLPIRSWQLNVPAALFHLLLWGLLWQRVPEQQQRLPIGFLRSLAEVAVAHPFVSAFAFALMAAFGYFPNISDRRRWWEAAAHTMAQMGCAFFAGWLGFWAFFALHPHWGGVAATLGGALASTTVMGINLAIGGLLGTSRNNAWLVPRCREWKFFLRLAIRPQAVDVHVIGRRSVASGRPRLVDAFRVHRDGRVEPEPPA